jgi:4-amino-4-deoxy-L-arabinose transferase-like glycosyltransferase
MRKYSKHYFYIIIAVTVFVRVLFMLWEWSGYHVKQPGTINTIYFYQGYGIAAGYDYVRGIAEPAHSHLWELYYKVHKENKRVTSEMAGPLPQEGAVPETLHPPGMPLLAAGLNQLSGMRADVPMQIMGILFNTIAVVLVYWITTVAFNRHIGFTAALLYALFPPLAWISVNKSPDGLIGVFVIASFVCIFVGTHRSGLRSLWWIALSGFLIGLGSYLRPDFLLLPLFMTVGLWAYKRRLLHSIGMMVLAQMIAFLVLLPWAYRNHTLTDRWIFTSTAVGPTLITGLGTYNNPWGFGGLDADRIAQASAQGIENAWSSEADLYFRKLFINSIKTNPAGFLKAVALRLPTALAAPYSWGFENPQRLQIKAADKKSKYHIDSVLKSRIKLLISKPLQIFSVYWDRLIIIAFSLCCLVAVGILLIKERQRFGLMIFIMIPNIYDILSHMSTHMEARYILPTMYCWIIGLAYLINRGWRYRFNKQQVSL